MWAPTSLETTRAEVTVHPLCVGNPALSWHPEAMGASLGPGDNQGSPDFPKVPRMPREILGKAVVLESLVGKTVGGRVHGLMVTEKRRWI